MNHALGSSVLLLTTCLDSAASLYTAVPPSPNPKSKVTKDFRIQLDELVELQRLDDGRAWFDVTTTSVLSSLNARSIRIVASQNHGVVESDDENSLASYINSNPSDIHDAISTWEKTGNSLTDNEPVSFTISSKKWDSFIIPELSATTTRRILTQQLVETFNWTLVRNSESPTYKFHLLLFESSVVLELVALDRPTGTNELPKPGFKRVESFALVKSLDIQPDDVVIDPMCGKGTFLIEAATIWPSAKYCGMDTSMDQLENAKENIEAAKVVVELESADARKLADWNDSSVDKIVCCPPFGRQFEKVSDSLYEDLMKEWSRVLKDTGRMAILLDKGNVASMTEAIQNANCQVDQCRTPSFQLGNIRATILLASKRSNTSCEQKETEFGLLWWEKGNQRFGRSLWAAMRSEALPSLVPYSYKRRLIEKT